MSATWQGRVVTLGRPKAAQTIATELTIAGRSARLIRFVDRLRPDAAKAIERLLAMGVKTSVLSGDNPAAVSKVAGQLDLAAQPLATPAGTQ